MQSAHRGHAGIQLYVTQLPIKGRCCEALLLPPAPLLTPAGCAAHQRDQAAGALPATVRAAAAATSPAAAGAAAAVAAAAVAAARQRAEQARHAGRQRGARGSAWSAWQWRGVHVTSAGRRWRLLRSCGRLLCSRSSSSLECSSCQCRARNRRVARGGGRSTMRSACIAATAITVAGGAATAAARGQQCTALASFARPSCPSCSCEPCFLGCAAPCVCDAPSAISGEGGLLQSAPSCAARYGERPAAILPPAVGSAEFDSRCQAAP